MKKLFYTVLLIHSIVLSVLLLSAPLMAAQLLNNPAPECKLTTLDGTPVDNLQAMQGEVVFVDFWASWCPPCIQSFPFLNQLHQDYADRGFRVMGINLDEKISDAEKFLSESPAKFSIVADPTKQCAQNFDVIAMPSSYLIDRQGVVRYIHRGFRPGETEELRLIVELLLENQP